MSVCGQPSEYDSSLVAKGRENLRLAWYTSLRKGKNIGLDLDYLDYSRLKFIFEFEKILCFFLFY